MRFPIISVIIPVYNAQHTLERCVDSVLAQSFVDFELILINDGSKDDSAKICERYQNNDPRVVFIDKPNRGVSSARNIGLTFAKGDYITFVDSDDALNILFLEYLSHASTYDIVLCSFICWPSSQANIFADKLFFSTVEIGDCLRRHLTNGFSYPWGKLFKRLIIEENNLEFDTLLHLGEDTKFVSEYLLYVKTIRLLPYQGYIYTKGLAGSLSRKNISLNSLDYSLRELSLSYLNLESKYGVDLRSHRYDLAQFFLHRFIAPYGREPYVVIRRALTTVCEYPLIAESFYDNILCRKGKVQRIFDFLARKKYYRILTFFYKVFAHRFFNL